MSVLRTDYSIDIVDHGMAGGGGSAVRSPLVVYYTTIYIKYYYCIGI